MAAGAAVGHGGVGKVEGAAAVGLAVGQLHPLGHREGKVPRRGGQQVKAGRSGHSLTVRQVVGRTAQGGQFGHRVLQNAVALAGQLAGHRHAVLPAKVDGVGVVGIGHAHPANLDAACAVRKALGGVVVKAEVRVAEFAQGAGPAPITVHREVPAAVDVLALDALGRHGQEPLAVQFKQVGALPHKAESLRRGQGVDAGPVELVGALPDEDLALIPHRAGPQHHVIAAVIGKHFGVAHMAGQAGGVVFVVKQALLGVQVDAVPAGSQADVMPTALLDVVVITGVLDVAGVVEVHRAALDQGGAGVDTVAVEGLVRVEHDGLTLPVHQVAAGDVAPVLNTAGHIKGAVLVEHVVGIADLAQAVGVVEPAHRGLHMEVLAVGVGVGFLRAEGFHQRHKFFQVTL